MLILLENSDIADAISNGIKTHLNGDGTFNLVGQESDGTLIFTCLASRSHIPKHDGRGDVAKSTSAVENVTHIGMYSNGNWELLHLLDDDSVVECCTVSYDKTIIAFILNKAGVLQYYMAEMWPAGNKYSNILKNNKYARMYFISYISHVRGVPGTAEVLAPDVRKRERAMLFIVDKSDDTQRSRSSYPNSTHRSTSIDVILMTLSLNFHTDVGYHMILNRQTKTDVVASECYWYQWDPSCNRLYTCTLVSHINQITLSCYQFTSDFKFLKMLTVPLDLPLPVTYKQDWDQHFQEPLLPQTSLDNINLQVITGDDGSLYVCYQDTSHTRPSSKISYTILFIHHGQKVTGSIPVTWSVDQHPKLFFTTLNNLVLVICAGVCVHVVDGSIEHEPGHPIILKFSSFDCGKSLTTESRLVSLMASPTGNFQHGTGLLYSVTTRHTYQLQFNTDSLLTQFVNSCQPDIRLALFHVVIVHFKHGPSITKLLATMCQGIASTETVGLMKEYLIGSSYTTLKDSVSDCVQCILPFTCSTLMSNGPLIDVDGLLGSFVYKQTNYTPTFQELEVYDADLTQVYQRMWQSLQNQVNIPERFTQFKQETVNKTSRWKTEGGATLISPTHVIEGVEQLPFLDVEADDTDQHSVMHATKERFLSYLTFHVKRAAAFRNTTPEHIAQAYVITQLIQAQRLLLMLWGDRPCDDSIYNKSLADGADASEKNLHMVVDRYVVAVNEIGFPLPIGALSLLSSLTFRSVSSSVFLQYVNSGALSISENFVKQLLREYPNSENGIQLKLAIVDLMTRRGLRMEMLKHWDHPIAERLLVEEKLVVLLTPDGVTDEETGVSLNEQSRTDGETNFFPLEAVLKMLQLRGADATDLNMVQKVALENSRVTQDND